MKSIRIMTAAALLLICTQTLSAQKGGEQGPLEVVVGGTFGKPKITPDLKAFALAQLTVNYKLTTTISTVTREKFTGKMAGAKITAYLETTDGELTQTDFQEVTDHFYSYFQRKLKENNIDTVGWSKIIATEFYNEKGEAAPTYEEEKANGQVWVSSTAHNGNTLYGGFTAFAFGKAKKAGKFCEELGAPAGFFYLTVDFADIWVGVDIKSKTPNYPPSYYPYTKTTTFTYDAATKPEMKVIPTTGANMSLLWNEKMMAETILVRQDIAAPDVYHTSISQDRSRLKNGAFAFHKEMDPVVIETTREQYKAAAKKALEKYADAFVATCNTSK
jgi:hypothetical protein